MLLIRRNFFKNWKITSRQLTVIRLFSDKTDTTLSTFSKFKVFRDEDSTVILDVEQERQQFKDQDIKSIPKIQSFYSKLNLERGKTGVFEISDLVDLLRKDNARNIFVCEVPKELKYVDYMCIVTGNSFRHMSGMANFVRKVFKLKRSPSDTLPKIEGENSKEWMAMDLGNIALHIFSDSARKRYDLESLWTLGPEYDKLSNQKDHIQQLFEEHSIYLNSPMSLENMRNKLINENESEDRT